MPGDMTSISTEVTFDITVPKYVSNELLVKLSWGNEDMTASWVADESWAITRILPVRTENELTVTFFDENGKIRLAKYVAPFVTGSDSSQTVNVTASQFDTAFDDDADGVSNLAELNAGSDPRDSSSVAQAATGGLPDVANRVVRRLAGYQLDQLGELVADAAFIVRQQTTITWPDNSYYQVQTAEAPPWPPTGFIPRIFGTVCEGGTECQIVPGHYQVVNHTTGVRELLEVEEVALEDQPVEVASPLPDFTFVFDYGDPDVINPTVTLTRVRFSCENGGSMIYEVGGASFIDSYGSNVGYINRRNYLFDQCQMTVRDRLLPNDNYTLNGDLLVQTNYSYGDEQTDHDYQGFSITGDSGLAYSVQGKSEELDGYDFQYTRNATITEYRKTVPSGQIAETIVNSQFYYTNLFDQELDVGGTIMSAQTGNQQVTVTTDPQFDEHYHGEGAGWNHPNIPLSGAVRMSAADGSNLHLYANPSVNPRQHWNKLPLSEEYTSSAGVQTFKQMVELDFYFTEAHLICIPDPSDGVERVVGYCGEGYVRNKDADRRNFVLP